MTLLKRMANEQDVVNSIYFYSKTVKLYNWTDNLS